MMRSDEMKYVRIGNKNEPFSAEERSHERKRKEMA
jgi:hypothetical protein